MYAVKKVSDFPVPSWDVTNQTLPARKSLISDGKIDNLFYSDIGRLVFARR
jgi:hypothetical protein